MTSIIRLLLAAAVVLPAGSVLAAEPGGPARLVHAWGAVTIESKSGARPGKAGARLAPGDAVATAEKSVAVIALPDGSRLKLRAGSRVAVELPKGKIRETTAFLSAGSVFAKIAKQTAGRGFRIRTPSAVAAVRGTEFFTAYGRPRGKSKDLWLCVNAGAVEVTTDKSEKGLLVEAGTGVMIKGGLDLTKPKAYDWTRKLNWNMDAEAGTIEDTTNLDAAYPAREEGW
ncbi:MAG: FecR family protein [Elusimicrobiota bacterium]|nr:FecR family protein [Elusimicrobiota bacterium]